MLPNYSVLMSLYIKEQPEFLDKALNSIVNQTLTPNEVVVVLDGPITSELEKVIKRYVNEFNYIRTVPLDKNVGLANALNEGLKFCNNNYVFRMDTDDIAVKTRCSKQLQYLLEKDLDILGSNIKEFTEQVSNVKVSKKMPLTQNEIIKYAKYRNPFNHPSVLFKKDFIIKLGGYKDFPLFEDYELWIRAIQAGAKCANLDNDLVLMRGNLNMYKRRGGMKYLRYIFKFRNEIKKQKFISYRVFVFSTFSQSLVALLPNDFRKSFYACFLRVKDK